MFVFVTSSAQRFRIVYVEWCASVREHDLVMDLQGLVAVGSLALIASQEQAPAAYCVPTAVTVNLPARPAHLLPHARQPHDNRHQLLSGKATDALRNLPR